MILKPLKLILKSIIIISLPFYFINTQASLADTNFSNLSYCKDSSAFKKRQTTSLKKLDNRLSLYEQNTKEYLAITKKIQTTKERFLKYEKANLLCGKDGLPRIIATGELSHALEFTIPGILFLYITGWIGWVGRKYLQWTKTTDNAFDNEIIIDLPIAFSIMNSGFLWPLDAWKELISGNLLESKDDITISPR